jgi:hypothetical protein
VVSRLDKAYRDCSHDLHPVVLSKSMFLETLIEYGFDHLEDHITLLKEAAEGEAADK